MERMDGIIYNIPVDLLPKYAGRRVVVRIAESTLSALHFAEADISNLQYVSLLSPNIDPNRIGMLADRLRGIPIDIVLRDPKAEFPLLYNFSKLIDKHPIRASIAVTTGFSKAVRLALALHFAVRLDVGQPDLELIDEMNLILDLYLHSSTVSQPVEYFHSMFLSAYRKEPASLWLIQEDDPDHFRYVTDDGIELVSSRCATNVQPILAGSVVDLECDSCEFFSKCGGYFKWPDNTYNCAGVKSIFSTIDSEASELRKNVAVLAAAGGETKS